MKDIKLKQCPFCGGVAEMRDNGYERDIFEPVTMAVVDVDISGPDVFWVECCECHCMSQTLDTEKQAEDAWNNRENILNEIASLQENYKKLFDEKKLTKKAICDLCIPFRDKYSLTDLQTLRIARKETDIVEIVSIFDGKGAAGNG